MQILDYSIYICAKDSLISHLYNIKQYTNFPKKLSLIG